MELNYSILMPFTDNFVTLKMTWWIFNGKCHKAILVISLTIYNKTNKQKKTQKAKNRKTEKETGWRRAEGGRQGKKEREIETQRQKAQPSDYKGAFLLSGLKSSHKKGIPSISNGNNQKYYFK